MEELFVQDGKLVSHAVWNERINALKAVKELTDPEDKIILQVKRLTESAVKQRLEGTDSVGICFSGGLDSSYIAAICKKLKTNFTCYTVGFSDGNFKDPDDIIEAQEVARFLKLKDDEFKYTVLTLKEMEPLFKKTTNILNSSRIFLTGNNTVNDVVNVGVGSVELAAYSISKKEKFFFSGLGSEELFAGYDRHKGNPTNEECFNGLIKMYDRDLLRDSAISKSLRFSFLTPFLDKELINYSLQIPIRYKINESGSKMILRKAASADLGKFSERPKKAAQYGSSFDRAILKLTKKHGFVYKKDYLKSLLACQKPLNGF